MPRALLGIVLAILTASSPVAARTRNTIVVKLPRFTLQPRSNVELCYAVRVPASTPFVMGGWRIEHPGAKGPTQPAHGLVYLYTGERAAEFQTGAIVQSRGCLDPLGPEDRDRRVLVASSASRRFTRKMPKGVGVELAPVPAEPGGAPAAIVVLVDVNWGNDGTRARTVSSKVVLQRAKKRIVRTAQPLIDRSADAGILVPPYTRHSTAELVDAAWRPATDSCVLGLSGQMHRHGKCIGVDHLDGAGQVIDTPNLRNPCEADERRQLFVGVDFTDPGGLSFTTPVAVRAGEALRYSCWVDNGVTGGTVRLGCETTPGVVPGSIEGGPAAVCSIAVPSSGDCPNGAACVPANAVAGPSADDEVCGLTALVYAAAPGGGCDVSSLP